MPRIARQAILDKFRGMIDRGEPIVGGGAGTGLSAKCEEAGGIDLIVIYNSGRYRMAGRGSLAGLLAYGNANEVVLEMAREVLPVVKHTPVLAGVNGTDPFMITDHLFRQLIELGFSGVQNFPTVGLIDGTFRANLEETGMGYGLEVEMIRLRPLPRSCSPRRTCSARRKRCAMARAGADILSRHMGLTVGGAIGAETALTASRIARRASTPSRPPRWRCARTSSCCAMAAPSPSRTMPASCSRNARGLGHRLLRRQSSMERLPTEVALTEQTRRFKQIGR